MKGKNAPSAKGRKPAKRSTRKKAVPATGAPPAKRLTPYSDEEFLEAIRKERGLVSRVADRLGCAVPTVYLRMKNSPEIAAAVVEARTRIVDKAESNVFQRVEDGSIDDSKWILNTIGKDRGYATRTETRIGGDASAPPVGVAALLEIEQIESLGLCVPGLRELLAAVRRKKEEQSRGDSQGEAGRHPLPVPEHLPGLPEGPGAAGDGVPHPFPQEGPGAGVD
jgi:hypothetical protein